LFNEIIDNDIRIVWDPPKRSRIYRLALAARTADTLKNVKANCGVCDEDKGLTTVLIFVRALNSLIAHEMAVDALDALRGIINLLINAQRTINPMPALSSAPPHAINRIRRAPYETVHKSDGTLAVEMVWYEARWTHNSKPIAFIEPISKHRKVILRWWRNMKRSPMAELLSEGYVRYCRALDNHDRDVSLMECWSALEMLLGTYKNDELVSRVVRLFEDEAISKQLAEHIRVRRNATVHAGSGPEHLEADTIVMQAQRLVARTLTFLTNEAKPFKTQKEIYQFLDLPMNSKELERQKTLISEFLAYRRNEGRWKQKEKRRKAGKGSSTILVSQVD
jgi:hypothetical protein